MNYVYSHIRKDNGKCFYIGKGTGDRAWSTQSRNNHWNNIVNKCGYYVKILVNGITKDKANELERNFISQIGLENLSNIKEGGQGGWDHITYEQRTTAARNGGANLGKKFSQEWKDKISKSSKAFGTRPKPEGFSSTMATLKAKHLYKELTTGFIGNLIEMKNRFINAGNVTIWGNAQHDRPLTRGKNKGLNFKII